MSAAAMVFSFGGRRVDAKGRRRRSFFQRSKKSEVFFQCLCFLFCWPVAARSVALGLPLLREKALLVSLFLSRKHERRRKKEEQAEEESLLEERERKTPSRHDGK